ncbi:MAG: nitrous oxide reductase accessory protein NosL [Gemmatimonadetes bacterium]|nr:nitrous oxide reductase accessory protein NosL [Gemmatimonadota bacterium]NIX47002.1 nitrous oxide reductase accessory protein NosL [Gemmatimonadota bacterium]NIY11365.1 nitrous oxide reductase accessory protein NosL [Gemmatimonadota bacterium]
MKRLLPILFLLLLLPACAGEEEAAAPPSPQVPDRTASCAVCGMTVVDYPGPKAQLFLKGQSDPEHFCSTRDFFAYLLEEDSPQAHRIRAMYVHDMGRTDWNHPHEDEEHWVPAKEAFYVVGSDRSGAMGPTLASFAKRADADAFAEDHGGEIRRFSDIDRDLVADLPGGGSGPPRRR